MEYVGIFNKGVERKLQYTINKLYCSVAFTWCSLSIFISSNRELEINRQQ